MSKITKHELHESLKNEIDKIGILTDEVNLNKNATTQQITSLSNLVNARIVRENKDSEGIFTTVNYYDPTSSKLLATSILSGGTSPQYETRTINLYADDGLTVLNTFIYALTYDTDGDLISETVV